MDVTSAKRYHLWDNAKMGREWRGGRRGGVGITWVSYDLKRMTMCAGVAIG